MREFYATEITEETKKELAEFVRWFNRVFGHEPLIVGGWAAWAYHQGVGSKDIDVVFPSAPAMHANLLDYFKAHGFKTRPVDEFDCEFHKVRKTRYGREVDILIDAVYSGRNVQVTGTSLVIPWALAEKFKRPYSFGANAKAYIIEPELLFAYKVGALIGRDNRLATATEKEKTHYESKLWKDAQDLLGLFHKIKPRPAMLRRILRACKLDGDWLQKAFSIAARYKVFAWLCPKHDKWIAVRAENTLKIDKALHEKWHEING